MLSVTVGPTPALDSALRKLEHEVAANVVVALDAPSCLAVAEEAFQKQRTLRCRYVNDRGEAHDREIEPWFVFSNWGRWYVKGVDVGTDAVKRFRIDRMSWASLGERTFVPPETVEVPEWFDLEEHERTVRVRIRALDIDTLPTPRRVENLEAVDDDRVDVDITVYGPQRLEHLPVVLPPEAEVVAPAECKALRRKCATSPLAQYET